jgi:uncharacterized protein (DUF486 family)
MAERRESPVESPTIVPDEVEPAPHLATTPSLIKAVRLAMASIWTIAILVLCWMPVDWIEEVEQTSDWFEIPNLDKVVHWGIFVVFAVLWLRVGTSRWRYAWVALAVITEFVQTLPLVSRDGNVADGVSDMIGITIGLIVARWIEPLLRGLESWVFRRAAASA